ncbi:class I SAM-dependent methyltransferase [Candidatus Kaiserbacteria bacterium]|nr:class I SAM-dependent methyltransferase [Candidatus Kaiserbacteria bacterium]
MEQPLQDTTIEYWDDYDTASIGVGAYTDEELLMSLAKGDILEVGCGRGSMIKKIKSFSTKTGIDPSKQAIEHAKMIAPEVDFFVGVAEKLPFPDESFDVVYSLEVFEHVREYDSMVSEMVRVLKKDGVAYIQTPNYPAKRFYDFIYFLLRRRSDFKDDYTHVTKFSLNKLTDVVNKHAKVTHTRVRNILGGKKYPIKLIRRDTFFAKWIGQKSIVVFKK